MNFKDELISLQDRMTAKLNTVFSSVRLTEIRIDLTEGYDSEFYISRNTSFSFQEEAQLENFTYTTKGNPDIEHKEYHLGYIFHTHPQLCCEIVDSVITLIN